MDVLKDIEIAYNNTPHKGLGFETPNSVHNLTDLRKIKRQEKIKKLWGYIYSGIEEKS